MSWYQLVSIMREQQAYIEQEQAKPPVACPHDGEPLRPAPKGGGLFCPLGNYEWPMEHRYI
jgi:hypothetical protein